MEFRTRVRLEKPRFTFSHADSSLFIGSCFAENIGAMMASHFFSVDVNPFGVLYNPASVASALRLLIEDKLLTTSDLFFYDDSYHSFMHHSRFSSPNEEECLSQINERLVFSSSVLRRADRLVVTFGTAWVYKLKNNGQVVGNCHKIPDSSFLRIRLTVDEIVQEWTELLEMIRNVNSELKILFTVSPIRHWKDGANGNQLSKATLLLAVNELCSRFPEITDYFPAYEIMLDELRDYRFYADDMLHPSPLAIEYIWNCFSETYLNKESQVLLNELESIHKALNHKPFNPESQSYRDFLFKTLQKAEQINNEIGKDELSEVIERLKNKLDTES